MDDQNESALPQQERETVTLNEQDFKVIMTYASLTKAVQENLTEDEREDVIGELSMLRSMMWQGRDAFRVALQLFMLEVDNSKPPFGERFEKLPLATWEEALKLWQDGGLK